LKLIIPTLVKFDNLKSLSLHSNKLTSLPIEICKLSLETLDISENPFNDLEQVCIVLKSFKTLENLVLDLSDEKEVDIVLSNLTELKTLNEKEVNDSEMKEDGVLAENQNDLEEIADI